MSNTAMDFDPAQIAKANEALDTIKWAGEQRLRDLRSYFMDSYSQAVEAINTEMSRRFREFSFSRIDNDPLYDVLWAAVSTNMGIWSYDHDGFTARVTSVTEEAVTFSLEAYQQGVSNRSAALPLSLIACPLDDAIATIRREYKRYFTEVHPNPEVAHLMDAEPLTQPEQPRHIAALVKVNGNLYVSTGSDRGADTEHWVQEKDHYGYKPTSVSWNELRRMGQIEVIFTGISSINENEDASAGESNNEVE